MATHKGLLELRAILPASRPWLLRPKEPGVGELGQHHKILASPDGTRVVHFRSVPEGGFLRPLFSEWRIPCSQWRRPPRSIGIDALAGAVLGGEPCKGSRGETRRSHQSGCRSVKFSLDGRALVVGFIVEPISYIWLWEIPSFEEIASLKAIHKRLSEQNLYLCADQRSRKRELSLSSVY
jgi:hypothetical protein